MAAANIFQFHSLRASGTWGFCPRSLSGEDSWDLLPTKAACWMMQNPCRLRYLRYEMMMMMTSQPLCKRQNWRQRHRPLHCGAVEEMGGPGAIQIWRLRWAAQQCGAGSGHTKSICCDPVRWLRCYMGLCGSWWWQLFSPRSAQGCTPGSSYIECIRCNFGMWICPDMGRSRMWWWQLSSPRPS